MRVTDSEISTIYTLFSWRRFSIKYTIGKRSLAGGWRLTFHLRGKTGLVGYKLTFSKRLI